MLVEAAGIELEKGENRKPATVRDFGLYRVPAQRVAAHVHGARSSSDWVVVRPNLTSKIADYGESDRSSALIARRSSIAR
jgi:hypothetical protein